MPHPFSREVVRQRPVGGQQRGTETRLRFVRTSECGKQEALRAADRSGRARASGLDLPGDRRKGLREPRTPRLIHGGEARVVACLANIARRAVREREIKSRQRRDSIETAPAFASTVCPSARRLDFADLLLAPR